jgi:hemerythrin-like metal-binding protein
MAPIAWSPELATGVPALDDLHITTFEKLSEMSSIADADFRNHYGDMVANMEKIFTREEQWMEETEFPGIKTHREHALHHIHPQVTSGNAVLGRKVIEDLLPQWLAFHISTMDMAWAMQITDCEYHAI